MSQGIHPEGAGVSGLEHLLAGEDTVPPDRGLFLSQTWRMNAAICQFVSEMSYEGRLHPVPECEHRNLNGEEGLRFIPVEHFGNRQASLEEAEIVKREVERLGWKNVRNTHATVCVCLRSASRSSSTSPGTEGSRPRRASGGSPSRR